MLTAIGCGKPDYVPLSFMIFNALRMRSGGWEDFVDRSIELGIDPVVDLVATVPRGGAEHTDCPGTPVHFAGDVTTREWRERPAGSRYAILHKEYQTPAGTLAVSVNQTDDWPYGDHVPFLNDYLEPRCIRRLVSSPDDLPALKHLLTEPTAEDLREYREAWGQAKAFAQERGLLLTAGWGVGGDALAWLCGLTNAVMMAVDRPEFLDRVLDVISAWNRRRMEIILETGVDLFIRRGWYEGTSFWSPGLYHRFLLPRLKAEAKLAHDAGAKFGYIMTVGSNQFTDLLLESGADVILGVEDMQDHGMDLQRLKAKTRGKVALWGGVNGFLTIEEGKEDDIRKATAAAMEALGPDGFVLSPVDNIRDSSEKTWRKVLTFIEEWKRLR
jgi:hypothetical protein